MVITLLILLIDASLKSRSPSLQQSLSQGAWVDRVMPVITASNEESRTLSSVWTDGLHMPPSSVASTIDAIATGASKNYSTVVALRPPADLGGPAGLLEAALLARSKAAAHLQKAFETTLGTAAVAPGTRATATSPPAVADPATVVPDVSSAGAEIQVGDQAYQLFLSSVPAWLGVKFPSSVWGTNFQPYTPQSAQTFLASMQSAAVTTPVYRVKILGVTTTPQPVSTSGALQILPDVSAMTVNIVLANTGNQPANHLMVTATITPAGKGTSSVRDFISLAVGQAYTVSALGPLNPPQGTPVTLTVTVSPQSGSSLPPATSALTFQMPAPTPPSTTTTPSSAATTPSSATTTPSSATTTPSASTTVPNTPPTT